MDRPDLRGRYHIYNYENAFAGHEPTAGSTVVSYRLT